MANDQDRIVVALEVEGLRNIANAESIVDAIAKAAEKAGLALDKDVATVRDLARAYRDALTSVKSVGPGVMAMNAQAAAAVNKARAVQQAKVETLRGNPREMLSTLMSGSAQQIKLVRAAIKQLTADNELLLAEARSKLSRVHGGATGSVQARIGRLEKSLATLQELEASAAIQQRVRGRQQNFRVRQAFARTPEGQAIEAASAAAASERIATRAAERAARAAETGTRPKPTFQSRTADRLSVRREAYNVQGGAAMLGVQFAGMKDMMLLGGVALAVRSVASAVIEFDNALKELSAVSQASRHDMGLLQSAIVGVSRATPFTVLELTNVATEMAKNGINVSEITKMLPNIANLAAAAGATLQESASIFSSAFEVFKVRGAESGAVADQLTVALTHTRLSADRFAAALQSVSTTAASNNLSFAETTAALGAMADQGLRSGTLLGTGLRQVLLDLEAPPKKLAERFRELGLTTGQLDVSVLGLQGVLENIKAAGFTAADAFASMQSRSAQAFAAMLNGADDMARLYTTLLDTHGAAAATAERMDSLHNQFLRLHNTVTALTIGAAGPFMEALKGTAAGLTSVLSAVNGNSTAWSVLGTVIASITTVGLLRWLGGLAGGMINLSGVTASAVGSLRAFRTAATEASQASSFLSGAGMLARATPWGIALSVALPVLIELMSHFTHQSEQAARSQEDLDNRMTEAKHAMEDHSRALESVDQFLEQAHAKSELLNTDQAVLNNTIAEARNKFGDLSDAVFENINTYDSLISKLKEVRQGLLDLKLGDIAKEQTAVVDKVAGAKARLSGSTGATGLSNVLEKINPGVDSMGQQMTRQQMGLTPNEMLAQLPDSLATNPGARNALDAIASGDSRQASQALLGLVGNKSGLDPQTVQTLRDALQAILQSTSELRQAADTLDQNKRQAGVTQLQMDPRYQQMQAAFDALGPRRAQLGHVGDINSTQQREQVFQKIADTMNKTLADIEQMRQSLAPADQQAFKSTPLQMKLDELKGQITRGVHDTQAAAAANAIEVSKIGEQTATQTISELMTQLEHAKTPAARQDIFNQYSAAAHHRRSLQQTLNEADIQKQNAAGHDPKTSALELALRTQKADAELAQTLERGQAILDRTKHTRPMTPPADLNLDPTAALRAQVAHADRTAMTSTRTGGIALATQESYVNAARSNGTFNRARLKSEEDKLNALRVAQEDAELKARMNQIKELTRIWTDAKTALKRTSDRIAALRAQFGIHSGPDNSLVGNFSNAAQQSHVLSLYKDLMRQMKSLDTESTSISDHVAQVQESIGVLGAKIDARNSGAQTPNSIGSAMSAGYQNFYQQHGLDASSYQNFASAVSTAMDQASQSFSDFITRLTTGSMRGMNVLQQFGRALAMTMLQSTSQFASDQLMGLIGQGVGSGSNMLGNALGMSGSGSWLSGAQNWLTSAFGMGGGAAPFPGYYNGGIVPQHFYKGGHVKVPHMFHRTPTFMRGHKHAHQHHHRIAHFAAGGMVVGANPGRDAVPAMLAGGEAVLNRRAVSLLGENNVHAMNAGAIHHANSIPSGGGKPPPGGMVNVYVVDKSTQPTLGPKDVLAVVGQDILTGGATKKLIQTVAMGG